MSASFTIDARKFDTVLRDYQRVSRKDWKDICNSKAIDVAFRALKETPKAKAAAIKAVAKQPWWPKLISKRMGKGHTREEAAEYSRKVIASRLRSVTFLKSGWLPAVRRLWVVARDKFFAGNAGGARQYGQAKGSVTPAVAGDNPAAIIVNSAAGIDKMGVGALQRAVDGAAADMADYIARKMEGSARAVAR